MKLHLNYKMPCAKNKSLTKWFRIISIEQILQKELFKHYHYKVGLSTLHPDFPIAEWDCLLSQAFLTLNLLQLSTVNPNSLAYAHLFGQFDFNKTYLAPPGSKVVIHINPSNRASWDLNGKIGFYTGAAPNHYRCMICFIPSSRTEITTVTLVFVPRTIPIPTINTDNFLTQAASDIITLLTCPPSNIPLTLQIGDSTKNGLLQLATLLNTNQITKDEINKQ